MNLSISDNLKKIRDELQRGFQNRKIVVATSGGIDSIALSFLVKNAGLNFTSVIVDHKYRKNSTEESLSVSKYLSKNSIANKIIELNEENSEFSSNIEKRLREQRYNALTNFCLENDIDFLFTAHHQNDLLETFLMRLEKGSGIKGLSSIAYQSIYNNVKIIRPFLEVPKMELKKFLESNNIKWFDDKTNKSTLFKRNKIRQVLEQIEDKEIIEKNLIQSIYNIKSANDFLNLECKKAIEKYFNISKLGFSEINISEFCNLHKEIKQRSLREIVENISISTKSLRQEKLEGIISFICDLENTKNASITCNGLEFIYTDNNKIRIIYEKAFLKKEVISKQNTIWHKYFNIKVEEKFLYRNNLIIGTSSNEDLKFLKDNYGDIYNSAKEKFGIKTLKSFPVIKLSESEIEKVVSIPYIDFAVKDEYKKFITVEYYKSLA